MPARTYLLHADAPQQPSAGDRQQAARDAYRQSVANGRPLTGIELGRLFDRSPRWGTSRIAEVRTEDIARNNRDVPKGSALPISNGGSWHRAVDNNPSLQRGNDSRADGSVRRSANATRGNGAHADDGAAPIGNGHGTGNAAVLIGNRTGTPQPIGNNGDHPHPTPSADSGASGPIPFEPGRPAGDADVPAATAGVRRITIVAVLAVALVAAVVSFEHQRELAALAGEGWRAWFLPVSVDGLVVAASMTMLTRRRAGQPAGALAWFALTLGIGASLAANVVAADPGMVDPALLRRLVAGWSPLALALGFELSVQQLRATSPRTVER